MSRGEHLMCPGCRRQAAGDERFCAACGLPLVLGGSPEPPRTEAQRRARKVQARYAQGELVRVAGARNQTEAEFLQSLLLEEGVPSVLRRTRGFDVPDFLAAGPREVLVPQAALPAAREILLQAEVVPAAGATSSAPPATRLLAGILIGVALLAALAWLGTALLH